MNLLLKTVFIVNLLSDDDDDDNVDDAAELG